MTSNEIREKFLDFFEKRGHKIVPSSSLIPDDKSVLLTTAGMQQFKPYYTGQKNALADFNSQRTCSIQKSFRTSDIDEVGDESHLTFFEMLGHFSFGDYFKKETIKWTYELLTETFKISPERISASVFEGDDSLLFDEESHSAWLNLLPAEKIRKGGREDNIWGPAGPEGPCGAANEVYIDGLEVATLVFMEYYRGKDGSLVSLPRKGVDVGWGLERLAMIVQGKKNIFETDLFGPLIEDIKSKIKNQKSKLQFKNQNLLRIERIIADHMRGSVFLIVDGVLPSNVEAGYILRRILRRAIRYAKLLDLPRDFYVSLARKVIENYGDFYPELKNRQIDIITVIQNEDERFSKTLDRGLKEVEKIIQKIINDNQSAMGGEDSFYLYESFGFPVELTIELAKEDGINVSEKEFYEELKKHQEISRAGVEKKFGGVGKEAGEKEARLHTATHLLHRALRDVLGGHIKQMGSDITSERLRFDFAHTEKMTPEQIKKVEDIINEKIKENLPVVKKEMSYDEAIKSGALAFFKEKYPEKVSVYSIGGDPSTGSGQAYSSEICAGPHAEKTGELGKFKIIKEESSGAGVRRIRAVLE